jgi:hypothetical protein
VSEVVIKIKKLGTGFSRVSIDGKYCGVLEDAGDVDSVAYVIRKIISLGNIDNTLVIEEKVKL